MTVPTTDRLTEKLREALRMHRYDDQLLDGRDYHEAKHDEYDAALDALLAVVSQLQDAQTDALAAISHAETLVDLARRPFASHSYREILDALAAASAVLAGVSPGSTKEGE